MNKNNILNEKYVYSFMDDKRFANKLLDFKFNLYSRTKLKMNILLFSIAYLLLLIFTTLNFLVDDDNSIFAYKAYSKVFHFALFTFLAYMILLLILLFKNSLGTVSFNFVRYSLFLLSLLLFYIKAFEVTNEDWYSASRIKSPEIDLVVAKYKAKTYFSNSMFIASIETVAYFALLYKNNNFLFLVTVISKITSFIIYSRKLDLTTVKIIIGVVFNLTIYIFMYIVRLLIHKKSLKAFITEEKVKNLQSYYEKFIDNFHSPIITINDANLILKANIAFTQCFYSNHNFDNNTDFFIFYSELLKMFYDKENKCSLKNILKRLTESNNGMDSMASSDDNVFINIGRFSLEQTKNQQEIGADCNTNQIYEVFIRAYYVYGKRATVDIMFNNLSYIINTESKKTELMLKDALFSKIAHEFKTPLITLTNQIELVENEIKKNPELHKLTLKIGNGNYINDQSISIMLKNIKYLSYYTSYLISDIIQYSSNNTYNKSQKSSLDIKTVKNINNCVFDFSYSILLSLLKYSTGHKSNIIPNKLFDSDLNKFNIKTDLRKLNQLLINILTNAVKFTRKGFITVFAYLENNKEKFEKDIYYNSTCLEDELIGYINKSAEYKSYSENYMIIGIKDTGEGISSKFINNKTDSLSLLFKDYNSTGSGFGLMICKQISELLDLEMRIHSYKGLGTIITVKIPLFTEQKSIIALDEINLDVIKRSNSLEFGTKSKEKISKLILKSTKRVSAKGNLALLSKRQSMFTKTQSKSNPLKRRMSTHVRCDNRDESEENSIDIYDDLITDHNIINLDIDITKKLSNMQFKDLSIIQSLKKSESSNSNNESSFSSNENIKALPKRNKLDNCLLTPVDLIRENLRINIPNTDKNINSQNLLNSYKLTACTKENNKDIIIICDDSKQILNSLENVLKSFSYIRNNYSIIKATDGSYLLTQIFEHQFSNPDRVKLVISDENMEFLDGSEFIKIIRRLQSVNKIKYFPKFVCLTAYEDLTTKERLLSSGFEKILYKPASKSELKAL